MSRLGQIQAPDLPLRRLQDRWAALADDPALELLAGDHLLHTDLNPHNILIGEHAHLVDWAWPTSAPLGSTRPAPTSSTAGTPPTRSATG